jgi:hypothetical protein
MTWINRVAPNDVVMCPAWAGYRTTKWRKFHGVGDRRGQMFDARGA